MEGRRVGSLGLESGDMPTRRTGRPACRAEGIAIRAAWLTGRHLAASLGAECGVCFPSFEDGTLGIPPGSEGWRVGFLHGSEVHASAWTPIAFPLLLRACG